MPNKSDNKKNKKKDQPTNNNKDVQQGGSDSGQQLQKKLTPQKSDDNSATATAKRIKALLKVAPPDETIDAARLDELRRIFARLILDSKELVLTSERHSSHSSNHRKSSQAKEKWNDWLRQQHDVFISQLQDRIRIHGRKSALRTFCGVIASSPVITIITTLTTNNKQDQQLIILAEL